jgi:peptidoglycan/xylan/chitin deacetylase (PgdA/CDA1 family)
MFQQAKKLKIIIAFFLAGAIFCLAFGAVNIVAKKTILKKNSEISSINRLPILKKINNIASGNIQNNTNLAVLPVAKINLELKGFSETVPILMYHYIEVAPASTTLKGLYLNPKIFENQLQELQKNNYQTLFIFELASNFSNEKTLGQKNIVLTFDDGYEDFYTNVYPLLKKYNYKATLYIIINALDKKGYLTRAQVRELADSGLVEIASHTFNHPDLRKLKDKDIKFEIAASKKILEAISGKPVLSFAYPFGLYKPEFFDIASTTGYTSAASVMPGTRQGTGDQWLLRRLRPNEREGQTFITWLSGWEKSSY